MGGYVSDSWSTTSVSVNALGKFINDISKMELYQIKIEGSSREENKIDALLSAYSKQAKKEDWNAKLTIGFDKDSEFDAAIAKFRIRLGKDEYLNSGLALFLTNNVNNENHFVLQKFRLNNILRHHICASVKKIIFCAEQVNNDQIYLEDYLYALFSGIHDGMDCIEFWEGELDEYEANENVTGRGRNIKRLKFFSTLIDGNAWTFLLSSDFPQLDELEIDSCKFDDDEDDSNPTISLYMPNTSVERLIIDVHQRIRVLFVIGVYIQYGSRSYGILLPHKCSIIWS